MITGLEGKFWQHSPRGQVTSRTFPRNFTINFCTCSGRYDTQLGEWVSANFHPLWSILITHKPTKYGVPHPFSWHVKKKLRRFPLNVRAVSAKIKLPKKYLQHCHILRTDKKNLSLLLLPSWPRERKLDLKLSIFQLKRRFMTVQNKMAPVFSILLRHLKLIFLRMLENFIAGSLGQVN